MSGFRAVNTTLTVAEHPPRLEETTPTTPKPSKSFAQIDQPAVVSEDAAKTPTRDSFTGMASQRPLPAGPFTPSHSRSDSKMADERSSISRESSHRSTQSIESAQDVDMSEDKDGQDVSDNESVNSDSRPSKKKKGQRFFCTEFPPCQLSFTRSEHLARHIRKHTGERPFQCHCSRRFSRLDNLRQHAQTVHVNEDIPGDSLAATGTRFQRQIRTDRVRPPASRSRASTLGSTGGHSRGHSRNLSSSSITSVSTTSSLGGEDILRRQTQTPLAMGGEGAARARLTLETYNPSVTGSPGSQHYYTVGGQSPSGYSTPTSTTFSQGTGSPRFSSGLHSPVSTVIPRSVGWEPRTPSRRLSVPSAPNPFTPQGGSTYPPPYMSPLQSTAGSIMSGNSSVFASPTASVFSHSRRDSSATTDAEWRRRTWHPGTHTGLLSRPGASGLSQYQTPDYPRPVFPSEKPAGQATRLPGIESFDHAPPQPTLARVPSPMQIDQPAARRTSVSNGGLTAPVLERGYRMSWDNSLPRGLNNLEIATPPREGAAYSQYGNGTTRPVETMARPTTAPQGTFQSQQQIAPPAAQPAPTGDRLRFSDQPVTPRKNKRHAWYNGPTQYSQQPQPTSQPMYSSVGLRTSPDGSSSSEGIPTPSTSSLNEYHPVIVHSNGYVEAHPPGYHVEDHQKANPPAGAYPPEYRNSAIPQVSTEPQPPQQAQHATFALQQAQQGPPPEPQNYHAPIGAANDMRRLEALVAVATREEQSVGGRL